VVFVLQHGKIEFAGKRLQLLEELLGLGVGVGTDGQNLDALVLFGSEKCFQLPELKRAIGSPVAAVKDQNDMLLPAIATETDLLAVRVLQREVGSPLPDLDPFEVRRRHPGSVFGA
jgi:hypothetical protein